MPTYNSEDSLITALESLLNQTNQDFEVLVIDGASTDTTLQILECYKDKLSRLRVFSEKDNGIYDAMNKGIKLAKGKWLYFMGSDDSLFESVTLEKVNTVLSETSASVVYGNAKIIGDTGWAKHNEIYAGKFNLTKLLNQNICHQAMFYDSKFVKEVGDFNLDYRKSSDWDYNLRCWSKQPFEYMNIIVANFSAGGFSSNSSDDNIAEDFVGNVMRYFKWNLFHPYLNSKNFVYYRKVQHLKREKYALWYGIKELLYKIRKKIYG
ncbi:glycosyltransferase family 2 protein [Urechidicola sp. KH5]